MNNLLSKNGKIKAKNEYNINNIIYIEKVNGEIDKYVLSEPTPHLEKWFNRINWMYCNLFSYNLPEYDSEGRHNESLICQGKKINEYIFDEKIVKKIKEFC